MSSQQLDEERIFHIAREIGNAETRSGYLDQICAGDQALRERVEELLRVHEQESSFLKSSGDQPPTEAMGALNISSGQQIGRYKLLQKIGEGGFGVVFMAEQSRPVRRKVALKVIKPGMDSQAVVARFEAERQALAMMDHPNIARVFDGGATDLGRPYFVMELVKGVPITEYCDKNELSTDQRLKLFTTVCQAVQHAHQKGIIHRDLKPSNVLVTLADGEPVVKVIDFGVAKATNQQLTEKTLFTAFGQMVGTPQYMSPEQAEMSCLDVDTRSDVYSLGVLLYELLTGTTPLEAERLRTAGYAEMQRLIREEEPPKPSTRLSTSGDKLTIIAKHRKVTPEKLKSQVKGDLDWIVMKALEKDRNRRYETPATMADDVASFLENKSVAARPPTVRYRTSKYMQRNRIPIAVASLVITVLSIALANSISTNRQPQSTLHTLWDVLADRALDATFSGSMMEAEAAISQAESAGAPRELTETLHGIALLTSGRTEEAIRELKAARDASPNSLIAQSALSWAYHHAAEPGDHEIQKTLLKQLLATQRRGGSDVESFFILLAQFVDGDQAALKHRLEEITALIDRHKDWGIAYALRARVQGEIARMTQRQEDYLRAIDDFNLAKARLPESALVNMTGLWLMLDQIQLKESQGGDTTELRRQARLIADTFADVNRTTAGLELAATFHFLYGDAEKGKTILESLIEFSEPDQVVKATERFLYNPSRIPMNGLRQSSDPEAQFCLAMSLASSNPGRDEIREINEVLEENLLNLNAPIFYVLMMDIPCVLGDQEMAGRVLQAANRLRDTESGWPWTWHFLDFYAGDLEAKELFELAGPFTHQTCGVHYVIAMKSLLGEEIDLDIAEYHFNKAIETHTVGHWGYHSAKLFAGKLRDESWRRWLQNRKPDTAVVNDQ